MVGTAGPMAEPHISRDDLEGAVRRAIVERVGDRRTSLITVTILVGLGAVAVAYHLGRRMGRLRSAIVEVRRL